MTLDLREVSEPVTGSSSAHVNVGFLSERGVVVGVGGVGYLGREHVSNPVHGALEEQSADQEADQHDVREQGAEVHHL